MPTLLGPTGQTRNTPCVSGLSPCFCTGVTLTAEPQVSKTCRIRSPTDPVQSVIPGVCPSPPTHIRMCSEQGWKQGRAK